MPISDGSPQEVAWTLPETSTSCDAPQTEGKGLRSKTLEWMEQGWSRARRTAGSPGQAQGRTRPGRQVQGELAARSVDGLSRTWPGAANT